MQPNDLLLPAYVRAFTALESLGLRSQNPAFGVYRTTVHQEWVLGGWTDSGEDGPGPWRGETRSSKVIGGSGQVVVHLGECRLDFLLDPEEQGTLLGGGGS
jgi:hypothetical protein